ncbi:protein ATP6V1FNB [Echinops telfairi]|uniref:Protein ATP6V1FNB n=1 Tax=Echinops telfairi TaxID=9371 RepID=A0ABM1VJX1_ECHTE|nr:protein ATP6V1FNB [Echinops telfairi]
MRDLVTAQSQAGWKERIQREAASRVAWKLNYSHKYLREGPVPRKKPQSSSASGAHPGPATQAPHSTKVQTGWPETKGVQNQLSRGVGDQHAPPKGGRAREALGVTQGPVGQTGWKGLEMRPASPSTLQLLFQGISYDSQGRARYLQERYRQKPQEKFPYPLVSSWEYGWHIEETMKNTKTPTYGRCQPITKSFYLRNGVFPFPRQTDRLM